MKNFGAYVADMVLFKIYFIQYALKSLADMESPASLVANGFEDAKIEAESKIESRKMQRQGR
jgi:hypothetical protein